MLGGVTLEAVDIAKRAVEIALDKRASDILLLDMRAECSFADYFVILSADSKRQIQAVCDELDVALATESAHVYRREGDVDSGWVLLDLADVIVHIFSPEQRQYYGLETLWDKAVPVVRVL